MRFQFPTYSMAIFFTGLSMGILGLCVLVPIACIQCTWNLVMSSCGGGLPLINVWQATLLYVAAATLLFLSGILQIEFEPEPDKNK
jgi:hypothetical protein